MKRLSDEDKAEQARRAFEQAERERQERKPPAAEAAWPAPEPLTRPLTEADPYPAEAFGELAGVVHAVAMLAQAPVALAGQSVLGALSIAVQSLADVKLPTGEAVPASVFLLSIAESGGRKSTCDRAVLRGVREFEREDERRYSDERRKHRAETEAWELVRKRITASATPRGGGTVRRSLDSIRAELEQLGPEPTPPMLAGVTTTEPTAEGLLKRLERGRPSLGLFNAEGGSFLAGHAMADDSRRRTAAILNALWDGAAHNRDRAGDGSSRIAGKRLALHIAATPRLVGEFLSREELEDNGLFSRFLVAAPESLAGSRLFREPASADSLLVDGFAHRLLDMLRMPLPFRTSDEASARELEPPALALDAASREAWKTFHDEVERELGRGGKLHAVRARVNKSAENAARVALLFTLANDPAARVVELAAMAGAVELVAWHINETLRLAEAGTLDPSVRKAEEMRRWMLETWAARPDAAVPQELATVAPPDTCAFLSLRDCYTHGPGILRSKSDALACVGVLVEHKWLVELPTGPLPLSGGRRPGPRYFVRTGKGGADGMA